ncbi:penicillin acylase family protein [Oscillatoria amoena NRMC-F 0135]|nr:penicillin acylase family protein [Oscillatoria amoena NRMC-F 0135]
MTRYVLIISSLLFCHCSANREKLNQTTLTVPGLKQPVEIIRDEHGVNHIFAQNQHDLFFAQGYAAAKDRLFQFEIWRRQATGTVAEILGEREIKRDIGARLFKYRGDLATELNHYHPQGEEIIRAFTEGVNAYIKETEHDPQLLPLEFEWLGIKPGYWTPEVVISRHQGLVGNVTDELDIARAVALLGEEKVKELRVFEPGEPDLTFDPAIDTSGLFENILELYTTYRRPVSFKPEDLMAYANPSTTTYNFLAQTDEQALLELTNSAQHVIGSNNWVVSGKKSASGYPLLANDPHRALAVPSLRYMVHLHASGWNVIGGGEPTIPGISIGHNEHGAWGLTVFEIDSEDLMVYDLDPKNQNRYRYHGAWEEMKTIPDTIRVKGAADVYVNHPYTRHGPVTFIDTKRNKAYAVRCAWLEPGGAPYLASLRMDVAKTWEAFREACTFSHLPGENMIWADRQGNIGWQVVGIAPVRKNWNGLLPVPGDGRYEWDGYLPIKQLPNTFNPEKGFWATANENLVSGNYPHRDAVGWEWADSSRANRVNEVLASKEKFTVADMKKLQVDYLSLPARNLVPYLQPLEFENPTVDSLRNLLLHWDYVLSPTSVEAAVYVAWEREIIRMAHERFVPEQARGVIRYVPLKRIQEWLENNRAEPGGAHSFLKSCFLNAFDNLNEKLGNTISHWQYGQPDYHHVLIKHPLSNAVNDSLRELLNCGPLPRGGNGFTPGMTGNGDNQTSGASFRMVTDLSDLNKTWFTNTPGQNGDIRSLFYKNLFQSWARDEYFTVFFSRDLIERTAHEYHVLNPSTSR